MPGLLALAVVFAGLRGDDGAVAHQVEAVLHHDAHVERVNVSRAQLDTLADFEPGAAAVVQALHVDGVVAGAVTTRRAQRVLRVVVFDRDGALLTLFELPIAGTRLKAAELAALRSGVMSDVISLTGAEPTEAEPDAEVEPAASAPAATRSSAAAHPEQAREAGASRGADADAEADADAAADTDTDITTEADPIEPRLGLEVGVGLGVISRDFAPGPMTVPGYASAGVPAIRFDGQVRPAPWLELALASERTLVMTSRVGTAEAATTLTRWELSARLALLHGSSALKAIAGAGRRGFEIEAAAFGRTPDGHYGYLRLGGEATHALGDRLAVRAAAVFEPVVSGDEPTAMTLGPARRWGVDLRGVVDLRAVDRLHVTLTLDYERFAWSWPKAGIRGTGGAVDQYPSAFAAVTAAY